MARGLLRTVKYFIMMCVGIFSSVMMWKSAADTFRKTANFNPEKPSGRCIGQIDEAEKFQKENNATTLVAYSVIAGKYRVAFCTDLSVAELDNKFGADNKWDPLEETTDGKCNLYDEKYRTDRESQCVIRGVSGETCQSIMQTSPTPYGVAWKYTISTMTNKTKPPSMGNATLPPGVTNPPIASQPCLAEYTLDDDMPLCPYKTVRFYHWEQKWVTGVYIAAAVSALGLWVWEIYNVYQFQNEYGEHYGDLAYMTTPNEGTWGTIYLFARVYIGKKHHLGDDPDPDWGQFARNMTAAILAQLISLIGIIGCSWGKHILLVVMFAATTLKLLVDIFRKAKAVIAVDDGMSKEDLEEYALDVPPPPGIQPNLNQAVIACVRNPNMGTYKQFEGLIADSKARQPYRHALVKICRDGVQCIPSEIQRLSCCAREEYCDPSIYNEIITQIQLYGMIQNIAQGGPGMVPRPMFPRWRMKMAAILGYSLPGHDADEDGTPDEPEGALLAVHKAVPQQMAQRMPAPPGSGPPHAQFQDMQPVVFSGPVVCATYGPANAPPNNVTQAVVQLQQQGRNQVQGGIHTAIGDPAPGVPKIFKVWYAQAPQQQQGYAPPAAMDTML